MSRKVYKAERFKKDEKGNLLTKVDTIRDKEGKQVVRADSKLLGCEVLFTGAGDNLSGDMEIGAGTDFRFDFSDANQLVTAPAGFHRTRTDWHFNDQVYIKEGTFFFFNMPKGSYVDMYIVCPQGYPYQYKVHGRPLEEYQDMVTVMSATEETIVSHWIVKNWIEGNAPMGTPFNTESAGEAAPPTYFIWRAEATVPDVTGWEDAHGHWFLEMYRPSTVYFPAP